MPNLPAGATADYRAYLAQLAAEHMDQHADPLGDIAAEQAFARAWRAEREQA
jgi:hypothetical protein